MIISGSELTKKPKINYLGRKIVTQSIPDSPESYNYLWGLTYKYRLPLDITDSLSLQMV